MFEFIILGLLIKHFIIDFPFQTPFMYLNKGTYGHPGGLVHAGLHGMWTQMVLAICGVPFILSIILGLLDFAAHYHIDWAKVLVAVGIRSVVAPVDLHGDWDTRTMKKMTEVQWRAAVDLLMDCLEKSQTQMVQVFNDPQNPKHHRDMLVQFDINKMIVMTVKKRIGAK
jgi:hypothetical protein